MAGRATGARRSSASQLSTPHYIKGTSPVSEASGRVRRSPRYGWWA